MKKLKADGGWTEETEICTRQWRAVVVQSENYPHLQSPCRIERHLDTDELFVVLGGLLAVGVAESGEGSVRWMRLTAGETVCVPRGVWHSSYAQAPSTYLLVEDSDTGPQNTEEIIRFIPKMED